MATVIIQKRKRQSRSSYILYYKDPATGQRKYYKTFIKQKDAQRSANELRSKLDNGLISDVKKAKTKPNLLSFEEVGELLVADWGKRLNTGSLKEKTFQEYVYRVRLLEKEFGKRPLYDFTEEEILNYRDDIAGIFTNITSNRSLFILKQIFKHGLELNAIKEDPVASIPYLSEKEQQRNIFLMPVDLDKLIKACDDVKPTKRLRALIFLGAEHGASKQEALSLLWDDIDFDFEGVGLIRFFRTKNGMERTEFLMPRTKKALLEWREHLNWTRHRKKIKDDGPGFVFTMLDGTPLKRFDTSWRKVRKIAGFEDLHFHDLRHTYCSNLLLSGADLKDVKEMIGHRELAMTDRYAHLTNIRKHSKQKALAEHYSNGKKEKKKD